MHVFLQAHMYNGVTYTFVMYTIYFITHMNSFILYVDFVFLMIVK
jgi:hypothetical protein